MVTAIPELQQSYLNPIVLQQNPIYVNEVMQQLKDVAVQCTMSFFFISE